MTAEIIVGICVQLCVCVESCTGCQSLRGSSTNRACWFTSRFWDRHRDISQTFWHWLPIFQVDLHCVLHRGATSSCRGHVGILATEPFLLLHRKHGTGYQRSWNCCDRRTCFVVIRKHLCFILSTGTKIRIDSVMRPRSSSRGHNTGASVTVTVTRENDLTRADSNLNVVALQYLRQFNPRLDIVGKLLRYFLQMLLQWNTTATITMQSALWLHVNDGW